MIDRIKFYAGYRRYFGGLNQSQVDGIDFLLDKLDASPILNDARWYAYILATIKHECAEKWQPINELGSAHYLQSKSYYPYTGKGYVQLTWESNYLAINPIVKEFFPDKDIMKNPDDALNPEVAWIICEAGMTKADIGPLKEPNFCAGQTLERYFNDNTTDWVHARRIINGMDCANLIAGYAQKLYDIIEFTDSIKQESINEIHPDEQLANTELINDSLAKKAIRIYDENIT